MKDDKEYKEYELEFTDAKSPVKPPDEPIEYEFRKVCKISDVVFRYLLAHKKVAPFNLLSITANLLHYVIVNTKIPPQTIRGILDEVTTRGFNMRSRRDGSS